MVILLLVVLGLCLGSFINALLWRLHKQDERDEIQHQKLSYKNALSKLSLARRKSSDKYSITTGRSMCTHCQHELAPKDLIPVVSYLWLRGKCRYCHKPIEDTPLSELLTPLLFIVSYIFWPLPFNGVGLFTFILWLGFVVGFVALSLYDLKWYLLPNRIVFPLIGLGVFQTVIVATVYDGGCSTLWSALWGVVVGSGIFYVLYLVSDGKWIGKGDVKLGIVLGLVVGSASHAFLVIFLASLLGTIVAVPLLLTGKASRTSHLPFGPYLIGAATIVVLLGGRLIDWYMRIVIG